MKVSPGVKNDQSPFVPSLHCLYFLSLPFCSSVIEIVGLFSAPFTYRGYETGIAAVPDVIVSAMPTIAQAHFTVKFGKKHNIPVIVDLRDLNPDVFVSPFHGVARTLVSVGIMPLRKMLGNAHIY